MGLAVRRCQRFRLICLMMICVLGCAPGINSRTPQTGSVLLEPPIAGSLGRVPPPEEGSLWHSRNPHGMIADIRAFHVGDIVTISITETAKASEIANTNTSKSSGVKAGIASLFGLSYPIKAFTDKTVQADTAADATLGLTSKGEGKTERQSAFTTYLTARVIQVLPNNNLMVQGSRHLRINNETEVVTLTGIVRPQDIDSNNMVASTKVAEARLEISGVGVVSDKQRQGWLTRIIDHIWPF